MEVSKAILTRRTTRAFLPDDIGEKDIEELLLAAHMAPIAGASYTSTHMTLVTGKETLAEVRKACERSPGKDSFYGAPVIVFFSVPKVSFDYIEYANIGCAIENILLRATDLGLGSAYIWGCLRELKKHPETIEKLQLPEGHTILSAVALGYPEKPLEEREPAEKLGVNRV